MELVWVIVPSDIFSVTHPEKQFLTGTNKNLSLFFYLKLLARSQGNACLNFMIFYSFLKLSSKTPH